MIEPKGEPEVPLYLAGKPRQENRALSWWYQLASPPEPDRNAPFVQTELFRRGRVGSQMILALSLFLFLILETGVVGTNTSLVPMVLGTVVVLIIATILNRFGKVGIAGVLVVLAFFVFPCANMIFTFGGLSMQVLPLYGLFIVPLLCAVSFLPSWTVFVVALGNSLFTWYSLTYLPHTAELSSLLAIAFVGVMLPIILVQALVSIVAYAWVQGTAQALVRANRAEEIARLEHDLALQAEEGERQKDVLDASIQKIVETHMRVANGDFSARVPLTQDNVLWQISGSLNNLLARFQRLRIENQALHQANEQFAQFQQNQKNVRKDR